MEDDHVDRPDVETQQCAKLTGTNRSIGLIALITNVHPDIRSIEILKMCSKHSIIPSVIRRPGGYGGASIPDPIPNSAVNRPSANGTSSQDAEE